VTLTKNKGKEKMQTITKTIDTYNYSELEGTAKDKARQWMAEAATDYGWYEDAIEDYKETANFLGIDIDKVYFSGFCSQGDGAMFVGGWQYAQGSVAKVRDEWPKDNELHRIARELRDASRKSFWRANARTEHRGHYYHSGCMVVAVDDCPEDIEDDIKQALRDFADWIYDALRKEYDYLTSEEHLADLAAGNDWLFDEDGNRVS
jgi:hypothetical protein